RLERALASGATPAATATPAAPVDPATGRAVMGGRARRPAPSPAASPAPTSTPPAAAPADAPPADPAPAATTGLSVTDVWESTVRPSLKPLVRAIYSAGSFTRNVGDQWYFAAPNAAHGEKCEAHRASVEAALTEA